MIRRSKFTDEQIINFLKNADAGTTVTKVCRRLGVSVPIFYILETHVLRARIRPIEARLPALIRIYCTAPAGTRRNSD
ncbi:MAG: transposase [Planctomycetes bacterium]|nr:transposase [Planctomycetota bacterium]